MTNYADLVKQETIQGIRSDLANLRAELELLGFSDPFAALNAELGLFPRSASDIQADITAQQDRLNALLAG